mgnify:FL=1|tara:strand:+ start:2345 stop:2836 length:492 start_codon:yes stop_codon:yes gene_type:complete
MYSQDSLDLLTEALDLESSSFVRYLHEVAHLRAVGDGDTDALALFARLYSESSAGVAEFCALLEGQVAVFPKIARDMDYARYNFIRPVFLLAPLSEATREHLEMLGNLADALGESGWEEGRQAVVRLIENESETLGQVESLAAKLGEAESESPQRRGSSASRW